MMSDKASDTISKHHRNWANRLTEYQRLAAEPVRLHVEGKLTRMVGLTLEAVGCQAAIGARCLVSTTGHEPVEAEVVGFGSEKLYLMPVGNIQGLMPNARVIPTEGVVELPVGESMLGRVVDGAGKPLDGLGPGHFRPGRASLHPGPAEPAHSPRA